MEVSFYRSTNGLWVEGDWVVLFADQDLIDE